MGTTDLMHVAITMGKVIKTLEKVEKNISPQMPITAFMEGLLGIAYVCRVKILDVIERNSYMLNPNLPVVIPLGLFRSKKTNMQEALELSIGKLKSLTSMNEDLYEMVNDILNKGETYETLKTVITPQFLNDY